MRIIRKYIAYLKDNPQGYWFKRKVWGWGWVPARWQGWTVLILFLAYIAWITTAFTDAADGSVLSSGEPGMFIGKIALAFALLIWLCYRKGEKPRWHWGFPSDRIGEH